MGELPAALNQGHRIAASIQEMIGPAKFERYFGVQPTFRVGPAGLEIPVPSGFLARLLDRQFRSIVLEAATQVTGETHTDVHFVVSPKVAASQPGASAATVKPPTAPPFSGTMNRRKPAPRGARPGAALEQYNLAHFIVGPCNRLAYESSTRVVDDQSIPSPALVYMHSACGMGKTHLLHGIALRFSQVRAAANVRVVTGEAFVSDYINSIRANRVDQFRRNHRNADLLCIDDISALIGKTATQQELVYTLDAVAAKGGRVCVTGPGSPRQVRGLSEGLISRLQAGIIVSMSTPDLAVRERVVRGLARRRGLELQDVAAQTIAGAMPQASSVRDMEGVVLKVEAIHRLLDGFTEQGGFIDGHSSAPGLGQSRRSIGLLTVQRALDNRPGEQPGSKGVRPPVRFTAILSTVCACVGVPEADVLASGRHALIVLARALCAYVARKITTMSYPEIARALQRPNHSTIITAYQRVSRQIQADLRVCLGPARGDVTVSDLAQQVLRTVQA